jgi:hypothetical protein
VEARGEHGIRGYPLRKHGVATIFTPAAMNLAFHSPLERTPPEPARCHGDEEPGMAVKGERLAAEATHRKFIESGEA